MMLPEGTEIMQKLACADVCPVSEQTSISKVQSVNVCHRSRDEKHIGTEIVRQSANGDKPTKPKQTRNRQKNKWKLKFHHQALPPEYLDHYEASLQKDKQAIPKIILEKTKKTSHHRTSKQEASNDLTKYTNQSLKVWQNKAVDKHLRLTSPILAKPIATNFIKTEKRKKTPQHVKQITRQANKVMTYNDLPYMGEMTLNNSKPRRGRKPKKADICHLIYENYGTIIPDRPIDLNMNNTRTNMDDEPIFKTSPPKTDLQNKLISSLLERKLTQENKRKRNGDFDNKTPSTRRSHPFNHDEPLNLCIRDLNDLKIQIQKKFGDIYSSVSVLKEEPSDELSCVNHDIQSDNRQTEDQTSLSSSSTTPDLINQPCFYWPNPQLYLQQLLYCQRLASGQMLPTSPETETPTPSSTPSFTSDSIGSVSPSTDDAKSKLVLKQISELLDPNITKNVTNKSYETPNLKRASPTHSGPVKRKRSAIFIPPITAKNGTSTPTTEVSICKFKFTGGSKPSLQEKKMLSVDSGGNFKYYSGTGKVSKQEDHDYSTPSGSGVQNQNNLDNMKHSALVSALARPAQYSSDDLNKKKRKTRKSIQREKLEQTFKEKGFLIQTQQLESAEGATYCKFRQLRKFTRYLFRSWKDYLPNNLQSEQGVNESYVLPVAVEATHKNNEWS